MDWNDGNVCVLRTPKSNQGSKRCLTTGGALNVARGTFKLIGTYTETTQNSSLDTYIMSYVDDVFVDLGATDWGRIETQLAKCNGYTVPLYDYAKAGAVDRLEATVDFVTDRVLGTAEAANWQTKWFALGQNNGAAVCPVIVNGSGVYRDVYRDGAYWFELSQINRVTNKCKIVAGEAPTNDWITDTISEHQGAGVQLECTTEEDNYLKRLRSNIDHVQVTYWQSQFVPTVEDQLQDWIQDNSLVMVLNGGFSHLAVQTASGLRPVYVVDGENTTQSIEQFDGRPFVSIFACQFENSEVVWFEESTSEALHTEASLYADQEGTTSDPGLISAFVALCNYQWPLIVT